MIPPRDEAELLERVARLGGRALGEIAAGLGLSLDGPTARTKGCLLYTSPSPRDS